MNILNLLRILRRILGLYFQPHSPCSAEGGHTMWAPPSEIIICELTIFDRQTQITPSEMIILLFSCYQVFFYHMYAIFFRMSGTISERQILMTLLDGTTARDRNQSIAHNLNYLWHTILLDCTIVRDLCTNPALGSVLVTKLVTTLIHPFHGKMKNLVVEVHLVLWVNS